jgi:hypothetical protein
MVVRLFVGLHARRRFFERISPGWKSLSNRTRLSK